jgi:hypothetical protein
MQETDSSAGLRAARALLTCSVVAGPLFLLIFVIQIFVRPQFHFTRSEPSLLSIGSPGWIQIANFVIGGLLVIAGATGMRVALRSRKGRFWGPLLLGVFGLGEVGVGVFVVDPVRSPTSITFHGTMHLICGGVGFVALMAACFVFVRTFASLKQKLWAVFCGVTGLLFLAAFVSAAQQNQGATRIQFFLNLIFVLEWVWVSLISKQLMAKVPVSEAALGTSMGETLP